MAKASATTITKPAGPSPTFASAAPVRPPSPFPVPNSRAEIQHAIGDIMLRIAGNNIDLRRAGLLLYALQTANSNLTEHQRQNAQSKPCHPEHGAAEQIQPTPASNFTSREKCHPQRSADAPGEPACRGEAESQKESREQSQDLLRSEKDLRYQEYAQPTATYGSGPRPDLPRPGAAIRSTSTPANSPTDFTPPPPQWRRISRPTGAALLEALGRHYGTDPVPGSLENRSDLNFSVSNNPDAVQSSAPPLGLKQD